MATTIPITLCTGCGEQPARRATGDELALCERCQGEQDGYHDGRLEGLEQALSAAIAHAVDRGLTPARVRKCVAAELGANTATAPALRAARS